MRIAAIDRLSFTWQFAVLSFGVLVIGMVVVGIWVSSAVQHAVINRTAGVTALYVDSFVSPLVQDLPTRGELSPSQRSELDQLITRTPLGAQIVSFKVWSPSGEILYSPNPALIGRTFAMNEHLRDAFSGDVVSEISNLSEQENEYEASRWEALIETYAPIRSEGSGAVFAVSEFYELPDALKAEIRSAQLRSWLIVGIAAVMLYLLLIGMVRRASNTIRTQRANLLESVDELEGALAENRTLQARISRAAARTTTLNERFLRRISADIHDGPAQDVSLALLRVEAVAQAMADNGSGDTEDVERLRIALESALSDLREISQGLRTPTVENLTPSGAALRAVSDYEQMTGEKIGFLSNGDPNVGSPPVKLTVYRVVHESLVNSFKHAGSASRNVAIEASASHIRVVVTDTGSGFELTRASDRSTLGLDGMRERVELLAGTFTVTTEPGRGTVVEARLPLNTGVEQ